MPAHLAQLLELAFDAVVVVDGGGVVRYFNEGAERVFGAPARDVTGRPVEDLMPERYRDGHAARLRAFDDSDAERLRLPRVVTGLRRDGAEFPAEATMTRLRVNGEPLFAAALRDLTDARRAEVEQAKHARQQAAVAGLARLALEDPDLSHLLEDVPPVVAATLGVEMSALLELLPPDGPLLLRGGHGFDPELVDRFEVAAVETLASQALRASPLVFGAPEDARCPAPLLEGKGVASGAWVVLSGRLSTLGVLGAFSRSPHRFDAAELELLKAVASIVGTALERRRERDALRRSEERLLELIATVDGVVWEAEPATCRFLFVSRRAERLLGYPVERWLEEGFLERTIAEEDRAQALATCRAMTAAGAPHELELRLVAADGARVWVRHIVNVVRAGDATSLRGLTVDISAQKRAHEDLLRAELCLQRTQRMEALGRLAAGVAHDFNNVLSAIGCCADLGRRSIHDPARVAENLDEVQRAVERAGALTRQLLAFGGRQALAPRRLNLNAALANVAGMLRRLLGERHVLTLDLEPGAGEALVDPGQLDQVVVNLVVNARDAMPGGGRITVETRRRAAPHEACRRQGPHVTLTVRDEGPGVPPEVRPFLFEPFFTTKPDGCGTGLGLSTAFGIVDRSGGTIVVDGAPGGGAAFVVWLPAAAREEAAPAPGLAPAAPSAPPARSSMLVIDPDAPTRGLVRRLLTRAGYDVLDAGDYDEAQRAAASPGLRLDLLISELVLPAHSGPEAAERFAERWPGLKVLFLTGERPVAQRPGPLPLLGKPFTPNALLRKVRDVLEG